MNKATTRKIKKAEPGLKTRLAEKTFQLKVESALEKVTSVAMKMKQPADMLKICRTISLQLKRLGVEEIRNVQTAIFYPDRSTYMNYEYYAKHDKTFITETTYDNNKIHKAFAVQMLKGKGRFFIKHIRGKQVKDWIGYQKTTNVFIDKYLDKASSLNYYWYSLGPVALGISTYDPLTKKGQELFKRFLKVFELAYRRYLDIEKANAQAREAEIQFGLERVRARTMAMQHSKELSEIAVTIHKELITLGFTQFLNCGYVEIDEKNKIQHGWSTNQDGGLMEPYHLPLSGEPALQNRYDAWKRKDKLFCQVLGGKDLKRHIGFASPHLGSQQVAEMVKKFFPDPTIFYCANFSHGYLSIITGKKITEEEEILLTRFTKEFEQSYARFLDLQKAEVQAREAEIQLALERVRARAMAMHVSQELKEVALELRKQMGLLDQKELETCAIHLYDESPDHFESWAALRPPNTKGEIIQTQSQFPKSGVKIIDEMMECYQSDKQDYVLINEGTKAQEFFEMLKQYAPKAFEVLSSGLNGAAPEDIRAYWSVADFAGGSLVMTTMAPPGETTRALLRRFANVFGLAYRRFSDLKRAEAQARESQIQLALERVRARTMAMQKSDELSETVYILFQQFRELGENPDQATIGVINENEHVIEYWVTMYGNQMNKVFKFSIDEPNVTNKIYKAWKENKKSLVIDLGGKALSEFMTYRAGKGGAAVNTKEKRRIINIAFFSKGLLNVQSTSERSAESIKLLERFAAVFEQTYTRFLDLQKAEAQAREGQIQLAMERIRARTMAMQHSSELSETATLLFKQINDLGIQAWSSGFNIWQENDTYFLGYNTGPDGKIGDPLPLPLTEDVFFKTIYDAKKRGEEFFVFESEGESLAATYRYMDTLPVVGDFMRSIVASGFELPKYQVTHCGFFPQGHLMFITLEPHPEDWDIFKRFTKVFEQTYTRFLDLQKAEAQAREAQIEAALERVRARTMAMQRSQELAEVATVLFQQVKALGVPQWVCGFSIFEIDDKEFTWYPGSPDGDILTPCKVPLTGHPVFISFNESKKRGDELFVYEKEGEFQAEHYRYMMTIPGMRKLLQNMLDSGLSFPTFQIDHIANFSHGNLVFITYEHFPEMHDIFKRFAKVFDLTYTRFLDLQKAEAQARESQIQLALERVRARTMAMQKSEEMSEVAALLFKQISDLGIETWTSGFNIWQNSDTSFIGYNPSPTGGITPPYVIPSSEDDFFLHILNAKQAGEESIIFDWGGEQLAETYRYMKTLPIIGEVLKGFEAAGILLPTFQINHAIFFAQGFLLFITLKPYPEAHDIFKRFAKVFEQTYTRFLDLQKAEAQARESQIQLALERVRARTMAMQKSEELQDVVHTLLERLKDLNVEFYTAIIILFTEDSRDIVWWLENKEKQQYSKILVPYADIAYLRDLFDARENGSNHFSKTYFFEEKNELFHHLFSDTDFRYVPEKQRKFLLESKAATMSVAIEKNTGIHLTRYTDKTFSEEDKAILKRFVNVFEQTYTRFLDLQKAEAQAREAQIEAALERVRSRTMGMQKSDELKEVIQLVYEQFIHLNIYIEHTGFLIDYKTRDDMHIWLADQHLVPSEVTIPWFDSPPNNSIKEAKEKEQDFFTYHLGFEEKNKFYRDLFKYVPGVPEETLEYYFNCPGLAGSGVLLENIGLYIENFSGIPYSEEDNAVLMRFGKVFQQTYTRFLDLQKAEAQAREAQIETSLERVRSKTMAMHSSNDVGDTVATMFNEFVRLDIQTHRCGILIFSDEPAAEVWTARSNPEGKANLHVGKLDLTVHALLHGIHKAWKKKETLFTYAMEGDDLRNYYQSLNNLEYYPLKFDMNALPSKEFFSNFYFPEGSVFIFTGEPIADEASRVIKRFAAVFGQTYRRYLDLQKAEAQARESQIQLALERVRARTMAMQKSTELLDCASLLFEQVRDLGCNPFSVGFVLLDKNKPDGEFFMSADGKFQPSVFIPNNDESAESNMYLHWSQGSQLYTEDGEGEELVKHFQYLMALPGKTGEMFRTMNAAGIQFPKWQRWHAAYFKYGYLLFITREPFDETDIFIRFASAFEQTYTRFLDLKKAEAQAREAQIENALEKVRSRSLGMHKSEELQQVVVVAFERLKELNISMDAANINIFSAGTRDAELWIASPGQDYVSCFHLPYADYVIPAAIFNAREKDDDSFTKTFSFEEKNEYFHYLFEHSDFKHLPDDRKNKMLAAAAYTISIAFAKNAAISIHNYSAKPFTDEENNILKRFTKVFEQAYVRFLDLQKAEAQAYEATIEAALEKVRGKAMAMHNSDDLSSTASVVFTELRNLGINPIRCGVGLLNKESRKAQLYSATSSADRDSLALIGWVELSGHPVLENIYDTWLHSEEYYPELSGEQLRTYYELLLKGLPVAIPDLQNGQKQYGHFLPFSVGCLYAWSKKPYNEAEIKILKRFATIIDLTFRRYIELQKSETNAREAVKQAALDRIRADIASMRTIGDLDRITPLIWNELTILGIPFIRCGVFIMDDSQQLIHTFLSTPDGKAIAAFHLPYNTPGNISKVISNWKEKKNYLDHWDEEEFLQFAEMLMQQGAMVSAETYLKTIPQGGFYLHFLPFLQGMLYVGNTTQLGEEEISLIQSIADAFSTAYARYEDFNKLETAKKQVDTTLNELQVTQKQLIQSEKMASLGELTAGIAHEIQNPLNFVNNFSDVSNELLEEMKTELDKGEIEEAKVIADDVKQNLEKILHHGKRADAIVKGMLQHSRSSSGVKEPTDINALADEYLRLAYHGLRAKDKSFNATMVTNYDATLEKVNVIPQDMGRVILNLITNAFYVVTEKKKLNIEGYEPTVTVTTKKVNNIVEVSVKDNGNGIPKKVLDKIFQPFFTTKPTGQGTGLGLSLSYDIVKAHGGEIKVTTKEGEESEFIIQIPIA